MGFRKGKGVLVVFYFCRVERKHPRSTWRSFYGMRLILCFSMCLLVGTTWSQEGGHPILHSFTLRQVGNSVQIDFAILGGASCNGVQLERSSDGELYDKIDEIQGVCGGSEFTEFYTLIDESPFQSATNHYRLILGNQGNSVTRTITFVQLEDAYRVFPNPAANWAVIKFDNPTEIPFTFAVYTLTGGEKERSLNITSNEIFLRLDAYEAGTYIFQLQGSDGTLITGKFIHV